MVCSTCAPILDPRLAVELRALRAQEHAGPSPRVGPDLRDDEYATISTNAPGQGKVREEREGEGVHGIEKSLRKVHVSELPPSRRHTRPHLQLASRRECERT